MKRPLFTYNQIREFLNDLTYMYNNDTEFSFEIQKRWNSLNEFLITLIRMDDNKQLLQLYAKRCRDYKRNFKKAMKKNLKNLKTS